MHPPGPPDRRFLEAQPAEQRGPLWGVPFAVKDNIDVAGHPTTAACQTFQYTPTQHARAVQPLLDAGALVMSGGWQSSAGGCKACVASRACTAAGA